MLLGYLKGEIEPPSPKTIEEAEKFEQEGYECLNIAIKSLEAWEKVKEEIKNMPVVYPFVNHLNTFVRQSDVLDIIDKYMQEVEHE